MHTDDSIIFARLHQYRPRLIHASLGPPESIPKWHLNRVVHFCTAQSRRSRYFTMGHPIPPQNCPCTSEDLDPRLIHASSGPPHSSSLSASQSVQPFLQGSQPYRQTKHTTPSLTIGCIYVVLQCGQQYQNTYICLTAIFRVNLLAGCSPRNQSVSS